MHADLRRLSAPEAAARAGKSVKTVRDALKAGALHGRQFTVPKGRWNIKPDCLEAWLDGERCPHGKGRAA